MGQDVFWKIKNNIKTNLMWLQKCSVLFVSPTILLGNKIVFMQPTPHAYTLLFLSGQDFLKYVKEGS